MKELLTEKNLMWVAIIALAILSFVNPFHEGRKSECKRMTPNQSHWDQQERGMQIERRERMKKRGNPKQRKAATGMLDLGEPDMMEFYRSQESNEHMKANEPRFGAHDFFLGQDAKLWE
jgi:hypothetical protein